MQEHKPSGNSTCWDSSILFDSSKGINHVHTLPNFGPSIIPLNSNSYSNYSSPLFFGIPGPNHILKRLAPFSSLAVSKLLIFGMPFLGETTGSPGRIFTGWSEQISIQPDPPKIIQTWQILVSSCNFKLLYQNKTSTTLVIHSLNKKRLKAERTGIICS